MVNMEHCRFRNTLEALRECREAISLRAEICHEEKTAAQELLRECASLLEEVGGSSELKEKTLWGFFENYVPTETDD